jgi:hypothetical protein
VIYSAGRYLVPWRDRAGVHARIVDAAATDDRLLDDGSFVGAAPLGRGFAVVIAVPGGVAVHQLQDGVDRVQRLPLADWLVPAVASDGAQVLLVTTRGGATAGKSGAPLGRALLVADETVGVELGYLKESPALWGDETGFIVGGNLLLDPLGFRDRAPAAQLDGARIFRRNGDGGDEVTLDGGRWLAVGAPATWATRDAAGITIGLLDANGVGERILHVGADLTPAGDPLVVPRSPSERGFVKAVRGDALLWEGTSVTNSDHAFAVLDRATLVSRGTFVRVPAPATRTVAAALGDRDVLLAWIAADGSFQHALYVR